LVGICRGLGAHAALRLLRRRKSGYRLRVEYLRGLDALRQSGNGLVEQTVLLGQVGKLAVGAGLALAIKAVLKAPLLALFGGHTSATALRYFLVVVFAGIVWPLTFPLWAKLGKKKAESTETA
jgi:hypothetical protein